MFHFIPINLVLLLSWFIILILLSYVFWKLDCNLVLAFYEKFFPRNKDKLKNKTVWIVGASSGIGEELAYQLAELNCRLILTATTESKLHQVKETCIIRSKNNLKSDDILVLAYDITDYKKNESAFKQIIDEFGNLDWLVNNAARIMFNKIIDEDFEYQRKIFDVNYFANIYIAKLATRHWVKNKTKGQIMVTNTVGYCCDLPYFSTYVASKKALMTFYRDLSMQHKEISVVTCCPGPTESELGQKSFVLNNQKANFGSKRLMSAKRCVELILISMANNLNESWITLQPWLFSTYLSSLFNYEIFYIFKLFNVAKFVDKRFKK